MVITGVPETLGHEYLTFLGTSLDPLVEFEIQAIHNTFTSIDRLLCSLSAIVKCYQ